ncbi:MAG: 4-(cytidine 5'-diphospho)-2-C-methyl-D-erythritol kinase [Alphaproteobacteria bacterium]
MRGASTAAAAKVNLALHVLGRREDGYHRIESLIGFAAVADQVTVRPANARTLQVAGPFAKALGSDHAANLAWRAADAFRARFGGPEWAITLEKRLPIAAGIGGGSADAAAVLHLLAGHAGIATDDAGLTTIALGLGADVPACLLGRPCLASGIGEILQPLRRIPEAPLLLVNPGVAVPTASVFRGWATAGGPPPPIQSDQVETAADVRALAAALAGTANMLEPAALRIAPPIGTVLDLLGRSDGCLLARMSGSGGTCFALMAEATDRDDLAREIQVRQPDWWVSPTWLQAWPAGERLRAGSGCAGGPAG